jgi:hypothetical protein
MLRRVVSQKFTDVPEVLTASTIAATTEAVTTSETLVNSYESTRLNIPEDSHLHIRRRENLKSHMLRHTFKLLQEEIITPCCKKSVKSANLLALFVPTNVGLISTFCFSVLLRIL